MISQKKLNYEAIPLPDRIEKNDKDTLDSIVNYRKIMEKRHTIRHFSNRKIQYKVIENAIKVAGSAPSGANHQPWHFTAISNQEIKSEIRKCAEGEEQKSYSGAAGDEWIKALEPIGTNFSKPHLEVAPWLIIVFAERYCFFKDGTKYKNYYVNESVGIATGFLISALHFSGLSILTHTPNPMLFLNKICQRPKNNKPVMILAVGYPSNNATVPQAAKIKKNITKILTII